MKIDSPRHRTGWSSAVALAATSFLALLLAACGSTEEGTEEVDTTPAISPTARLEYRIDSLKMENRRLKEQLDALALENRNLTAKSAELETKLTDTQAQPPAAQLAAPAAPGVAPARSAVRTSDAQSAYQAALEQFNGHHYAEAVSQMQALLSSGAPDEIAGHCHYWIGESYYGMKNYDEALKHFQMVMDYRKSPKLPAAQFMIGNCYAALGDKDSARNAYTRVVTNYPVSSFASKAQARLSRMK